MVYRGTYSNGFYHHGIKGQKWGERNGPPYPLGAGDHSASEKRAGWKKSLDKGGNKGYNKGGSSSLTDEQKKALAKGAVAVAGTLAVYGAYKAGLLNADAIAMGRQAASSAMDAIGDNPVADITEHGFKRLNKPESLEDSLRLADPFSRAADSSIRAKGENGCSHASIAGFLRQQGYDVTMKAVGKTGNIFQGEPSLVKLAESNFKLAPDALFAMGERDFLKSPKSAGDVLRNTFGDNASGICGVHWDERLGNGSHAFNWIIKDGNVSFIDFQQGRKGQELDFYWSLIDQNKGVQIIRLDNARPKFEELHNIIE